ncbi:MAG: molecular chaperone HtpG [Opitutales bacterium]|nr:molecular chaperone HtpG [Opitutales bacterium]
MSSKEQHSFQAEVGQLLDIVTHSIYTDREIFVRELVSNAADALEKLRHTQLTEKEIFDADLPLEINIQTDEEKHTITLQDYGIGMTQEELVENLGTIAHSGSKAFMEALRKNQEGEKAGLIGQFGVGFYSAFMVADSVTVHTHSYKPEGTHLTWTSDGKTGYTIEESSCERRGAKIVLQLKEDAYEFATESRIEGILKRYSSFVPFPVNLNGKKVNTVQAIWMRNKNEITEEEYTEFYKYQANAFDEPLLTLHFSADAPLTINALLFTPKENMERFGFGRMEPGVALYCKKVLIDPNPKELLPEWLRFLKGVIDSADLPLSLSRETMQDSELLRKISKVITGRYIKHLSETASKDPEAYNKFYETFHVMLKEGVTTDYANREKLAKLLRYESSLTEAKKQTGFEDYLGRMGEKQESIYYIYGKSREAIENTPHLEAFKARNIEVIYLTEAIDEFVMTHLGEFEGKKLVSVDAADLDLDDVSADGAGEALGSKELKSLCSWMKQTLGEAKVSKVEASKRLVDSPVIALNTDKMYTPAMRQMMKAMQQDIPAQPAVALEVNAKHPLIKQLAALSEKDGETAALIAEQIYDNALISAGYMEDARNSVPRIYKLLEKLCR